MRTFLLILLVATPALADSVVLMPIKSTSLKGDARAALDDLLAVSMSQATKYKVMTSDDIKAQLGRDQMRMMLDCDAESCAAEIGGALGARYILAGSARPLGKKLLVTLSLIDTKENDTARGKAIFANKLEEYPGAIDAAVADLMSKVGSGAAAAGGAVAGMALIPAGDFVMGCNELKDKACNKDELPRRTVQLDAYYIDRTEVTVSQYSKCMDADACTKPKTGKGYNYGNKDRTDHPVNGVDWRQADSFCKWKGQRLPTEAQWEKAARGSDGRVYPWGDDKPTCKRAVMAEGGWGCGKNATSKPGEKPEGASPYGVHDMAGNVAEWVNDYYSKYSYKESGNKNPRGPEGGSGSKKVVRGDSLASEGSFLRVSRRDSKRTYRESSTLGFRCAKPSE